MTKLLSNIETGEKTTSEELYKLIKERILTKNELIPKNLMAIATDGEPSMTGRHQGLISRVENDYDHLLAVRDLCHIYNLICQKALEEYKGEVVKMVKYIASHFSKSPLRVAMLDRIQKENGRGNFLDVLPYKEKRWLSLTLSLERILKIWDDLKVYFTEVSNEGLNYFTEENQSHARCLFILLSQLTHYNKEFQRTEMNYHEVITTMKESFTVFAREVLPKEYDKLPFEQLYEISFQSEDQPKILNLVQFKERFNKDYDGAVSETLSPETKDKLFEVIRNFILKILCEMQERLPINQQIFKESRVVFFDEWDIDAWRWLAEKFHNIIGPEETTQFQNELKRMSIHFSSLRKQHENSNRTILESWDNLSGQYPNISKLAKSILVLPHSSVPVERIFSQMQDFKTEKRNRLTTENLETSLLIYQAFSEFDFVITSDMIERYKNLHKKENPKNNEVQGVKLEEHVSQKPLESKAKEKKFILVEINDSEGEYQEKKKVRVIRKYSQSFDSDTNSQFVSQKNEKNEEAKDFKEMEEIEIDQMEIDEPYEKVEQISLKRKSKNHIFTGKVKQIKKTGKDN